MKYWDELVKIGLLGTEKMPLSSASLPPALQATVSALDTKDREAYFYKCAALVLQYERAGTQPIRMLLPRVQLCKDESLPYMPAAYASVLQALLGEKYRRFPRLLIQLLQKIVQKGYIVSPEWICALFKQLETREFRQQQSLVLEATGERGKWLLQFQEKLQANVPISLEKALSEGTNEQMKEALLTLRHEQPGEAFRFISEQWTTANARERKEWLKILTNNISPTECGFYEAIHRDLDDPKALSKNINVEIKEIAANILLGLPESNLFKQSVAQLQGYLRQKKTMLGLMSKTTYELPQEPDHFLCATVMQQQFGHTATPSTNELLTEYWFCYFLNRLHPSAWEIILNTHDWKQILTMLDDADNAIAGKRKKQRQNFRWYLSPALSNHNYKTAVDACLASGNILEYQESILHVLSNEALERYAQKNIDFGTVDSLRNCLLRENWVWSPELSKHVLSGIMNNLQASYYNGDYLANTAHHFHRDIIAELKKFDIWNTEGAHLRQQLHQRGLEPLLNYLEMRERIIEI